MSTTTGITSLNISRELGRHLTGVENMFFQVEHTQRLMTICSIWIFNHRLDTTLILDSLKNLCIHYPRFCLVPKHGSRLETPIWSKPNRTWNLKDHLVFHTLDTPSTLCLQKYIASQYIEPFDPDIPLWQIQIISGLRNNETAVLWKAHHCISDGIGIMKAVFATTTSLDPNEEIYRQQQKLRNNEYHHHHHHHHHRQGIGFQWTYWIIWIWHLFIIIIQQIHHELWAASILVTPVIQRLCPFRSTQKHLFDYKGDQTQSKLIAWTDDIDIADIRKLQQGKYTLNDVMLMIFARTIKRYKKDRSYPFKTTPFRIVIPLSLRSPTDWSMNNKATGNILQLDTINLEQIHQRMMILKRSIMPLVVFYGLIQSVLRYFPFLMAPRWIQHWYANLPQAIFTNIAGPTVSTFFAGQEIKTFHVLPPQAGKGCLSVGLVSSGNKVNLSILTDNHPDYPDLANILCKIFMDEFNTVLSESDQR